MIWKKRPIENEIATLNSKIVTIQVSTGINNVIAYKTGNVVFLSVISTAPTAKGWYEIGYLPSELRPVYSFYSPIALTNTDNAFALLQIISASGKIQIYNPNTTANSANGLIMYVV